MRALIFAFFLLVMAMTPAQAACTLTGLQPSGSTIINAGTYTGSTLTFAVSLSFRVTTTGTGGTCAGSVAFRGTATSPQMTDTNGNKLNYSLLGYYSTTPGARGTFSVTNPNTGSLTFTLNSTLTIAAGQSAATGAPNGVYQDLTVSLVLFPSATSTTVVGTLPLTITARVATPTTCTIAGSASGGTRNLDFSNGRTISTSTQTANFGSVTCNSPTTLTLTSSNGGVKSAATAPVNMWRRESPVMSILPWGDGRLLPLVTNWRQDLGNLRGAG